MQGTALLLALLAASVLVGCPKLGGGSDADAAADAAPVAVATAPVPVASATAEPAVDPKKDPSGCKPGQLSVKLTEVEGGVASQKCRQVCGQGRPQCPQGQTCTGSTSPTSPLVCVNVRPGPGSCKAGDRLLQGSAATLFSCVTPCKADTDCPKQRPACGPDLKEDADNPALKFKVCVKCVLPSPPPCAAPHVASPKGLCQLPCPNGSCAACGGTCQNGFCAGG